jgi:hypothetical protein
MTKIDIAGTHFTTDSRYQVLTEAANPVNDIRLNPDQFSADGSHYLMLYDTASRREFDFDESITELADGIVFLEIPIQPGAKQLKADVTPWRQTNLTEVLAENRRKIESGYWDADEDGPRRGRGR